jgi:hypothetical protein
MKSTLISIGMAILGLQASAMVAHSATLPVGDPASGSSPFSLIVHEDGANSTIIITEGTTSPFSASIAVASGPDGVPEYSTGGVFLQAGDIYWLNPAGVSPTISDMLRIYPSAAGVTSGDTFSVFSMTLPEGAQESPIVIKPDSPYDVPTVPANTDLTTFPSVAENGTYVSPGLNGAKGTYTFLSDTDVVPEPTGWAIGLACALGWALFMPNSRRRPNRRTHDAASP